MSCDAVQFITVQFIISVQFRMFQLKLRNMLRYILSNIAIFSNLTSTTIKAFIFNLIQDECNLAILIEEGKHSFVHKVIPENTEK